MPVRGCTSLSICQFEYVPLAQCQMGVFRFSSVFTNNLRIYSIYKVDFTTAGPPKFALLGCEKNLSNSGKMNYLG